MNRLFLFVLLFFSTACWLSAQKSKVIGAFQLIEKGKYEEAKSIIERATKKKSTSTWPRTWYARGLLCQNAYRTGIKKNDTNLFKLSPDQLYVALSSFEKTRQYDKRGRYDKILAPRYVFLANDLIKLGEKHFNDHEFKEAFRAYESALQIYKSGFLTVKTDTNLLYNTALSAYKSGNWNTAIRYLTKLNDCKYSSNVPHLMFSIYIIQSDTSAAEKILLDGIKNYDNNEKLVLLLVDLYFKKTHNEKSITILNDIFRKDSSNYIYPFTIGLLYQKTEEYYKAIEAYKIALTLPSDTLKIYTDIGTCYLNIGVEIDEKARTITNNSEYLAEKEKSVSAYKSAIEWFERACEMDSDKQEIISKLYQLYMLLDEKEKIKNLDTMIP